MGFFKGFKRDFAQAVNELMPDKDELSAEYDDEDMVNTFDDGDNMDIAPEDMLAPEETDNLDTDGIPEELFGNTNIDDTVLASPEEVAKMQEELFNEDEKVDESDEPNEADELKSLDSLDEQDMEENTDDAKKLEGEEDSALIDNDEDIEELEALLDGKINISKDVSDAIMMREELSPEEESEPVRGNDDWEDNMAEIEQIKEEMDASNIESILSDDTTYITKSTVIDGNIKTDGGLDIIGTVNGNVTCDGKLILGGSIKGGVTVGELYANAAKIEGDVLSEGSVKIGMGSVVVGNVVATSAVIAGAVNGDIDVQGPVIVDSTAVIMGNIKSRTVQINNGAVIEGFCSQCYSEIDVKSFFE